MAQEKMFKAALEAIDQGQSERARDLFTRLLRSDSSKAEYWLWMSTLVDTQKERIYCLESALRADPDNVAAKRGLIILGARQAGEEVRPIPPVRRQWVKDLAEVVEPPKSLFRRLWANPTARLGFGFVGAFILIGIVMGVRALLPEKPEPLVVYQVSPYPTRTLTPTVSPTITRTPVIHTPTPAELGPTPLWMFLTQTYTPMPLYVNTPHPAIEAYRAGMHAYGNSNWQNLADFMAQAIVAQPEQPDLYYYQGEAFRMMGDLEQAVIAYGDALEIDPKFAPAYLGRALAYEAINPKADIEGELNYALDADPFYVDAYLERARIRIKHNNPQGALDDLLAAESQLPDHPMIYVLRGQAYLKMGDLTTALENAQRGYELDRTSLPAHLTLAEIYLAQSDYSQTLHYIIIYLSLVKNDAEAWGVKAQVEYLTGHPDKVLSACDQGIAVDPELAPLWYYRGLVNLERGDTQTAVNDLVNAVNLDLLSFDYSIALAKALWADGRLPIAIRQFTSAESLATSDTQRAVIYYNRAQVYEQAENLTDASQDWALLLALPVEQVPPGWRTTALEHWLAINPPTPTETPTETPIPTATITPTPTPTHQIISTITINLHP